MVTPVKFTREVRAETEPSGFFITFIVRASLGAVTLRVRNRPGVGLEGWTLNSHFKRRVADWWIEFDHCDILSQDHCYGDTGYIAAEQAWAAFLTSTEDGWKFLEDTYNEWRKP